MPCSLFVLVHCSSLTSRYLGGTNGGVNLYRLKNTPMKLKDITVKNAKPKEKQYKLADGEGMFLLVMPNGQRYWRLKYRFNSKEKQLALGVYPQVSLSEARQKRQEAKDLLKQQIDPGVVKKQTKLQLNIDVENSFENIARRWHQDNRASWVDDHATRIIRRLEHNIFPDLGSRPIDKITPPELLAVVKKIEERGAIDVAGRVLQTCGQIFRYAIASGIAERDVAADLRGALKVRKTQNHKHLKADDLPELFNKLDNFVGDQQTQTALYIVIHTFVRTIELRAAKWDEIDFGKQVWKIPAERMKMKTEHVVPLSKQVIKLFEKQRNHTGNHELAFPGRSNPLKPISANTLLYALYDMGYRDRATVHGFRATASTILNEHGFKPDVIERQLAHAERNQIRAAYNHAEYMDERREMMQWWSDYLEGVGK